MEIILSIKPKYVERIFSEKKKYEFRKSIPKRPNINKIIIYSSSPVKKIVGFFDFDEIINKHPKELWNECKENAGIDEKEFFKYFANKDEGFAIKIKRLVKFNSKIDPKKLIPEFNPPQSFCYSNILTQKTILNYM